MALGQKQAKPSIFQHIRSLGTFGILVACGGVLCGALLAFNLYALILWTPVQAEVRAIEQTCTLETKSGSKTSKRKGLNCAEAEAIRNSLPHHPIDVKYDAVLTFAWAQAYVGERTAKVEDFGPSGDFTELEIGDVVPVRVSSGTDPWVHQPRSWKTTGGLLVFTLFAYYLCWPRSGQRLSRFYIKPGPLLKTRASLASWATALMMLSFAGLSMGLVLLGGSYLGETAPADSALKLEWMLVRWGGAIFGACVLFSLLIGVRVQLRRPQSFDLDRYIAEQAASAQNGAISR